MLVRMRRCMGACMHAPASFAKASDLLNLADNAQCRGLAFRQLDGPRNINFLDRIPKEPDRIGLV